MSEVYNHQHNCIEELKADHEEILKELNLLKDAVSGPETDRKQVERFLHFTETFAEFHHKKEEDILFPELEKRGIPKEGGPIEVMLSEHKAKREYVRNLQIAVKKNDTNQIRENSLAIITLLQDHIDKENNILYPMAESVLSEEDLAHLSEQCELLRKQTR